MSRPIVKLHTIAQWFDLDPTIRSVVLQNIKLKDRLLKFLSDDNDRPKKSYDTPEWVPCHSCEKKGWVLMHPRYPGIHPSQLAGPCRLKVYNEMIGAPGQQKIEPKLRLIFDVGHAVHDMFQKYGERGAWGPQYQREVEISPERQKLAEELMLEGHADAENILVIDSIPNAPNAPIFEVGLVHEYKTIHTDGFDKLTRPKPEHIKQAMIYSAALDRPIVVYLYFNKNNSNLLDFPVAFDPVVWDQIRDSAAGLVQNFDQGVAPQGNPGFHCQSCPYVFNCADYAAYSKRKK